jgi:hypothetical protein
MSADATWGKNEKGKRKCSNYQRKRKKGERKEVRENKKRENWK